MWLGQRMCAAWKGDCCVGEQWDEGHGQHLCDVSVYGQCWWTMHSTCALRFVKDQHKLVFEDTYCM